MDDKLYAYLRDTPTDVIMKRMFDHMNTHCDTCDAKLSKEGRCPNKKWWMLFHNTFRDTAWTYYV